MAEICLVRHGETAGNALKRYIGVTDEPLTEEGKAFLQGLSCEPVEAVFCSPLIRCRETAGILYPENEPVIIRELSECDFGEFENRNYKELSGNTAYQAWIDSNGTLPFPGGESREDFKNRSLRGFEKAVHMCIQKEIRKAALVVHGGTIMNIMEKYGEPSGLFYEWHVKNGGGYKVSLDLSAWEKGDKKLKVCKRYLEG